MPILTSPRKVPRLPVIAFSFLAFGLLFLTYLYTSHLEDFARKAKETELTTVANLKAVQVSTWRQERLALVKNMAKTPQFATWTKTLIKKPGSAQIEGEIREGLGHIERNFPNEFVRAAIFLPDGKVLFQNPQAASYKPSPETARLVDAVLASRDAEVGYLYRDDASGRIFLPVAFAILDSEADNEPIAAMTLDINPLQTLFPFFEPWPSASPTSEILLIRRAGDQFIFLSNVRGRNNGALSLSLPYNTFRRPEAQASLGWEGISEGEDYRGREVLAYIKVVPDSPWLLMAKTDLAEIYAGWSGWIRLVYFGIVLLIVAAGTILAFFWQKHKAVLDADERRKWEAAVKSQDDFLKVMIDVMPNPAFLKDTQGKFTGCNAAFGKLVGLSKEKILGRVFAELAPKDLAEKDSETDRLLFEKPGVQVYESSLKAYDGADHNLIFIKSTYPLLDGSVGGLIATMIDITQRKRTEEELQQIKKFSDGIVQTMSEGLVMTDSEGRFTFVNPAAAAMLGYTPGEMIEKDSLSFHPKEEHSTVRRADERRAKGLADRYELDFIHKDGSLRTFLVSGGPRFKDVQYEGTMAVLTDITERKKMEEEIRSLSLTDALTNLYNRRGFQHLGEQQLKLASRLKKRVYLLYADVDDLKQINDRFGHKEGDRVLADLAAILKNSFRDSDIIARTGGDEFVVLAMETTKANAEIFIKRLEEKLDIYNARPDVHGRYKLSISTGIATFDPELPSTIDDLVNRADAIMYKNKRNKKTR
jgi:diguanylate cyclase (GGDEF)-like protein/PAS domain S-box-containing protein